MITKEKIIKGKEITLFARSLSSSLGKKERIVATFIANKYSQIPKMNIEYLARHLDVSTATIVKVCKKLNCNGFYILKNELQKYVKEQEQKNELREDLEDFNQNDSPMKILQKVFYNSILALQDTLSILDEDNFSRAVDAFDNINKVLLFGVGGSGTIANDISHKFLKVGYDCYSYNDANLQAMAASLLEHRDIAIGISHSGTTRTTIDALKIAKKQGAITICVTNFIKSPIVEVSDIKLVSSVKNSPLTGENATTRLAHLTILDALFMAVILRNFTTSIKNLKKTSDAVINKRLYNL